MHPLPHSLTPSNHSLTSIYQAIEGGEVSKHIFDAAQVHVLSQMESQSLPTFLSSETLKELVKRIQAGEMDELVQEDIENVKDIMSKEVSDTRKLARRKLNCPRTAAATYSFGYGRRRCCCG